MLRGRFSGVVSREENYLGYKVSIESIEGVLERFVGSSRKRVRQMGLVLL